MYNNLANLYGHTGPVKKAFEYYAKAIELNPQEPLYYHNFGDTVYLFRKDAMEFYGITEQQVYDKALELYSKALKLDPQQFPARLRCRPDLLRHQTAAPRRGPQGLDQHPGPRP